MSIKGEFVLSHLANRRLSYCNRKEAAVDAGDVSKRILEQYQIRVDPSMSQYVLKRLEQASAALRNASIPIMGGQARTGVPVREFIDPSKLLADGERA